MNISAVGVISAVGLVAGVALATCGGEPASTWDDKRGRYVSTYEARRDEINREIDRRELEKERESVR